MTKDLSLRPELVPAVAGGALERDMAKLRQQLGERQWKELLGGE